MHKLLFFSRVTFICNLCFLLAFILGYYPYLPQSGFTSSIIILGFVVAFALNFLLHIVYLTLLIAGNSSWKAGPRWLLVMNFCFLLFQLIFLLL